MSTRDRFTILATLPDAGGFRRALALDRSGAARPVVLAFPPASTADDAAALAALSRDAETAGRVNHPGVVSVVGLETAGDALALVELYRPGVTVRELLDAGGRLPADVAVRVAADACAGVAAIHAVDPRDGRPLAHGGITPERLLVLEDGTAALAGLAAVAAQGASPPSPAEDLRAIAAVLHECLSGEPPASPAAPLVAPGLPPALVAAVDRALGVGGAEPWPSAAALGAALASASGPASHAGVAAYVDAILPPGEGARGALARLVASALPPPIPPREDTGEVTAELIADGARTPAPVPEPAPIATSAARLAARPAPIATRAPAYSVTPTPIATQAPRVVAQDAVATFPRPEPRAARSRAWVAVAVVCAAVGFGIGFVLSRAPPGDGAGGPTPTATATDPTPVRPESFDSAASGGSAQDRLREAALPVRPERSAAEGGAESKGERSRRAATQTPTAKPPAPKPAAKRVATRPAGTGILSVTAPLDAEVLLDGKRIGKGIVRKEIPAGAHTIEVRLGEARVSEKFSVASGETWTYDVSPQ